jgi:Gpi18-like mannosyltransferase
MGDLLQYRLWTRALTRDGLAAAYWPVDAPMVGAPIDYPPLFPYALWVTGHALERVSPVALQENARLLDFLIRAILVASNLLLALLVYLVVRRATPERADLALALVALNPALIFDTAYWGQADAFCALLITAAFVALACGRPEWSWTALAAAALAKPIAYPLAPLIFFETLRRFGLQRALRAGAAALGVVCAAFVPFLWAGHLRQALRGLVTQVDAMPYISVNAHNLWWLVGRGLPWTNAYARPLGLFSWNTLSLLLFGAFYLGVLARVRRSPEPQGLYVAAATVSFGFFVLSTHMHENHLFYTLPLLALAGAASRPARRLLALLTLTMLANMLLHDFFLTYWARPHVPGPHVLLPPIHDPQLELQRRLTQLGYPWIAPMLRGESSLLGLVATMLNAQVIVLAFLAWLAFLWQKRSLEGAPDLARRFRPRYSWAAGAIFVIATGAPFLAHLLASQAQVPQLSSRHDRLSSPPTQSQAVRFRGHRSPPAQLQAQPELRLG